MQDNANKHLAKVKAACADLKSKIVENPEKLKVTIQEMDQQLQAEREAVQGTDKKSRELQAKIDGLVQLEQVCLFFLFVFFKKENYLDFPRTLNE